MPPNGSDKEINTSRGGGAKASYCHVCPWRGPNWLLDHEISLVQCNYSIKWLEIIVAVCAMRWGPNK